MTQLNDETVAQSFERHVPQHPLPEEIKKMDRDDTVCKFCGVSYLIHNEIKAMEDKLNATLKELKYYQGSEAREARLKEEVAAKDGEIRSLQLKVQGQDKVLNQLKSEMCKKDDQYQKLQETKITLEEKLGTAVEDSHSLRLKHGFLVEGLRSVKTDLGHQKVDVHQVKVKVSQQIHQMRTDCSQLSAAMMRICQEERSVKQQLEVQVAELTCEQRRLKEEISGLEEKLSVSAKEVSRLGTSAGDAARLKVQLQQLEDKIHGLDAEKVALVSQHRGALLEMDQYKDQLRRKTSELESLEIQSRSQEQATDFSFKKLTEELSQKEADLEALRRDMFSLQRRQEETERAEAEIKRKASASHSRVEEIEEELDRVRGDCDALRNEREMMITAHQNQIEQLRESFKVRLADVDRWPQKLEEELRRQKQKHVAELAALEARLKKSFVHELQIEKQKHQQLLNKYLAEYKEADRKLKSELSTIQSNHQGELSEVHRQVAESKARSRETENSLRQEVESLKNIIRDLEARLVRVDTGGDAVPAEWRHKQALLEQTMEEEREEKRKLEQQLEKMREENTFLQETVRRECEERFELTEALSVAREELLQMKRPAGGYVSNSSTPRQGNSPLHSAGNGASNAKSRSNSRLSGQKSEEILLYKKRTGSGMPHPPSKTREQDLVDRNNVLVAFGGEKAKSSDKVKGTSLGDSRRRIAEAVGRT